MKKNIPTLPCGRPQPLLPISGEQKMEIWKRQFKAYLEANKLKYSEQRWKIAQFVLESKGHFSAQEMVERVNRQCPEIGAATVYRNIRLLCDAKILKETLVDAKGTPVYECYHDEHHDHIVCLDCNEVFEFQDSGIESLQTRVSENLKFREIRHRHIIYARCEYASKK